MGTLEKSSYALMKRVAMLQYGTFLHIRTFLVNGVVIFLIVPYMIYNNWGENFYIKSEGIPLFCKDKQ